MAVEAKRGCGHRKQGGTYLVSGGAGFECGRLPLGIVPCPLCEHRPAFTRGLQRINPKNILHAAPVCKLGDAVRCLACPLGKAITVETAGLMWVGDRFYTPESFTREMVEQGVSKRVPQIPKWLKVGETWVFLAHEKAIAAPCATCTGRGSVTEQIEETVDGELGPTKRLRTSECETCEGEGKLYTPAVFTAFVPERIERIIPDTMPEEERASLRAQGLTLVEVPADDPDHVPTPRKKGARRDDDEG